MRISNILIFLLIPIVHYGQRFQKDTSENRVRSVIWTIPVSRNTTINGLAVGFMPIPWRKAKSLKINGVSVSASPIELFIGVIAIGASLDDFCALVVNALRKNKKVKHDEFSNFFDYPSWVEKKTNVLNGLIVGGITGRDRVNGINLTFVGNIVTQMRGVSISGLLELHHSFKGVTISGFRNKVYQGSGLQIGLFNQCETGRVVQIGLVNKIGKRVLPILNLRL